MNWKQRIGLSVSQSVPVPQELNNKQSVNKLWLRIGQNSVSQTMNLYPSFLLFFTKMIVAHQNIVSIFDLLESKWTEHLTFTARVTDVFRHTSSHTESNYEIGILLENGIIRLLEARETIKSDFKLKLTDKVTKLPGKVVSKCFETNIEDLNPSLYFLLDKSDEAKNSYNPCSLAD